MPAWLERIGIFARAPDTRPLAEIAAEIDEELAAHIAFCAQDLEAAGFDPGAAHAEAEARFGDIGHVRKACVRVQIGERLMIQRIQLVLTACLLVAVAFLGFSTYRAQRDARAQQSMSQLLLARLGGVDNPVADDGMTGNLVAEERESGPETWPCPDGTSSGRGNALYLWKERFTAQGESGRHGLLVAKELAQLPDAMGGEILLAILPQISTEHREQVALPFMESGHPSTLPLLAQLALFESSVNERVMLHLRTYAWKDLQTGDGAFDEWMARWRDRPLTEVLEANARRWALDVMDASAGWEKYGVNVRCELIQRAFEVVDDIRPEIYERAGIDLGAILKPRIDVDTLLAASAECDNHTRQRIARAAGWCNASKPR